MKTAAEALEQHGLIREQLFGLAGQAARGRPGTLAVRSSCPRRRLTP